MNTNGVSFSLNHNALGRGQWVFRTDTSFPVGLVAVEDQWTEPPPLVDVAQRPRYRDGFASGACQR